MAHLTATGERLTGSGARREEILYRTASAQRRETSAGKAAISGVMTALVIAVVLVTGEEWVIAAIVVALAIAVASVTEAE